MATKVENLKITKVDFVDRGANPDAHVMLFKRDSEHDGQEEGKTETRETNILKRFVSAVGKLVGAKQEDIDATVEEITKSVMEEPDDEPQVHNDVSKGIVETEDHVDVSKNETTTKKGEEVMIDKSKMTPAERAFYEDLQKRYSVDDTTESTVEKSGAAGKKEEEEEKKCDTKKSASAETDVEKSVDKDDPYAGLHPVVKAELEMLKKRAEEADNKELLEIAKKYEILGKKPEELVPVLKSLKDAGGTAYADMLTVLDASVEAVNKSSMFSEIGKGASYAGGGATGAWARIEKKADELMAADAKLSRHQAIDLACQQNPTLVHDYENEM
jgi:hypothetical protein